MNSFRRIVSGAALSGLLALGGQPLTAQEVYTGFCVRTNNGPGCWLKDGGTCVIASGGECRGIVL